MTAPSNDDIITTQAHMDQAIAAYTVGWEQHVEGLARAWDVERSSLLDRIAELEGGGGLGGHCQFGSSKPIVSSVPAVRVYVASGKRPTDVSQLPSDQRQALQRVAADGIVVISWKEAPGPWLTQLLTSVRQLLPDATVYGCQNHEPYDNFGTGRTFTLAEYHRRWDAAVPLMVDAHVIPTTILDGSHPESWEDFSRDDAQVYGMDRYNPGIQSPREYLDPAHVFGEYVDYLVAHGKPGLVAETGTGRTPDDLDGSGQLEWTHKAHSFLDGTGLMEAALWWSAGELTLTPTLWEAWLHG